MYAQKFIHNFLTLKFVKGPIAQRLEQSAHNREVPGSNPGGPTTRRLFCKLCVAGQFFKGNILSE